MAFCFSFCYFRKLTATTHGRIDGGLRGSWSCIERRAQTEAAALIKTRPDLSQALGKEGEKGRKKQRREEERGKLQEEKNTEKSLLSPLDMASAGLL